MGSDSVVDRVQAWCAERVPADAASRVRLEVEAGHGSLTIVEHRSPLIGAKGLGWRKREIARLRHSCGEVSWTVDWLHGNQWRRYSRLSPTSDVDRLLSEIARDPCGVFWSGAPASGGEERRRDVALA